MKPEQRHVIELSLCVGYSHRDITDRLRLSPDAVTAHLTQGLMAVGGSPQV
jgi:DNA-directed RNA polymerase specialized sigma24 family protein